MNQSKINNSQVAAHLNNQAGAIVNKSTQFEEHIKNWFRANSVRLRSLCGNKEMADRILIAALNTVQKTPTIVECDTLSFCNALMQCAEYNLMPGFSGEAYILPFKKVATFVLGYQGVVQLLYRSAMVKDVDAQIVCEKDFFEMSYGTEKKLIHEPAEGDLEERGEWIGAYAIIENIFGGKHFYYMNAKQILGVRERSPGGKTQYSPWNSEVAEEAAWMWMKCPLKGAAKLSPKSTKPQSASIHKALIVDGDSPESARLPAAMKLPELNPASEETGSNGQDGAQVEGSSQQ